MFGVVCVCFNLHFCLFRKTQNCVLVYGNGGSPSFSAGLFEQSNLTVIYSVLIAEQVLSMMCNVCIGFSSPGFDGEYVR